MAPLLRVASFDFFRQCLQPRKVYSYRRLQTQSVATKNPSVSKKTILKSTPSSSFGYGGSLPAPKSTLFPTTHLHLVTSERQSPVVTWCWRIPAGSAYEDTPTVTGASHYLRHAILMGNASESALSLTRMMELRGAQLNIQGDRDVISIELECPREHLDGAINSLAYLIEGGFHLEEWQFDELASRVQSDYQLAQADPSSILREAAMEVAFRQGLGYSPLTNPSLSPKSLNLGELKSFWKAAQRRTGNAVGIEGMTMSEVKPLVESKFLTVYPAPEPLNNLIENKSDIDPYYGGERRISYRDHQGRNHVMVAFGTAPGEEAIVSAVLAGIVGGSSPIIVKGEPSFVSHLPSLQDYILKVSNLTVMLHAKHYQWPGRGGMLAIHLAVSSSDTNISIKQLIEALCRDLRALYSGQVNGDMVMGGKARAMAHLAWECESRRGYARKLAASPLGQAFSLVDEIHRLEELPTTNFKTITSKILARKPVYIGLGNLRQIPHADEILF